MRWTMIVCALSAGIVACSNDARERAPLDAGDGAAQGDAATDEHDATAADVELDAGRGGVVPGDADAAAPLSDASSSRDAGAPDSTVAGDANAGSSSDAGEMGAGGCVGKTYKLCEDFESASVGALPSGWTVVSAWGGGSSVVAGDEFHSGEKALKSAPAANGQTRAGRSLASLGATANKHWGRIFFKVKSPATFPPAIDPPDGPVIHNTLVGLKGATESRVVDTVANAEGKVQFLYNLPDDSCCEGSKYLYAAYDGNWHCAEWYLDATAKQFRFYYDGAQIELGFDAEAARLGQYTQVIVGFMGYQTTKTPYNQAWFDDLAMDDSRIGCN